jgi:hypothetical protein
LTFRLTLLALLVKKQPLKARPTTRQSKQAKKDIGSYTGRAQKGEVGYKEWEGRLFKKQTLGEEEAIASDGNNNKIDFEALQRNNNDDYNIPSPKP